jgi:hypothetical protein
MTSVLRDKIINLVPRREISRLDLGHKQRIFFQNYNRIDRQKGMYAYNYLMMPRTIKEIADTITRVRKQTAGYERYSHPFLTMNN